jgi:uncharacterized membrane protein
MTAPATTQAPRKRRRIFLWVFMIVQVLFVAWVVSGAFSSGGSCQGLSAHDCATASNVGHGVAIALQLITWVVVDLLLAIPYVIYRLARRPAGRAQDGAV